MSLDISVDDDVINVGLWSGVEKDGAVDASVVEEVERVALLEFLVPVTAREQYF